MTLSESKQTTIIKALPIKRVHNKMILLQRNVFNLMVPANLPILGTKKTLKTLPKVGSIVKIKTRFGLKSLIIVNDRPSSLAPHSKVKMIFAATRIPLLDQNLIKVFNNYLKRNHLTSASVSPQAIVVQGYHYGFKDHKPYVNTTKKYNFKVTNVTNHIEWMAKDHSASVLTQRGKSLLVVSKIKHLKNKSDLKTASQYKPVISFHNYGIKNEWINKLYHTIMKKRQSNNKMML